MKVFMRILMSMLFIALLGGSGREIYAQTVRQIDASRLVKIEYPSLTAREGKGLDIPLPPDGHPRVFFRKAYIPLLKNKMNHPLLKECSNKVYESAKYATDGRLVQENVIHNFDIRILDAIEARAFLYALTGDKAKGNEAVDYVFNLNNSLIIDHKKQDVCREIGRVILTTALVYDWCYDLISEHEKKSLIAIMESLATDMEIKWPRLTQNSVTGHGVEAQVARDMLCCGIATYDEKPEIYMRAAGRIFAEFIPAQNFNYLSGHHHQGNAYGPSRFVWEMYTTLIFDRMGYPNITDKLQGKIPYYWIYTRRPDGQLLRDGDSFSEQSRAFGRYWTFPAILTTASYYKDPILMGEAIKEKLIGSDPLFNLLLVDPEVKAEFDLSSLPLTKYFPTPYGGMVARTSWDEGMDANTVVAEMKVVEYNFVNHHHLDAGSFQIYHKGPLAVPSGIYQGANGGYGSDHFNNYYQRTIAHNCILVYDPGEKMMRGSRELTNDGGQRHPADAREPATLEAVLNNGYRVGDILAHGFGPDEMKPAYSYLKGDITQAYTDKVKSHKRSFVFLNLNDDRIPAALIVYDNVTSSNKDFKKTWLLHSVQEPVFRKNELEIIRNEKGYNGRLVNTTLLPLSGNLTMKKVGGEGNEYSVNGINYPQYFRSENNSGDNVIWRTEISPQQPSETDVFLNVMQVMGAGGNIQPLTVEKIETETHTGAKLGDRIVLFSKNSNMEEQAIKLKIEGKGTFKVLLTDLTKGNWTISSTNKKYNQASATTDENNLIYFEAPAGNYIITKKR